MVERIPINGGAKTGGTTPVPNALFDAVMPTLSDTQLRVILVVARSTLGWREGVGRKETDWLSHRQLQKRTGRAGAAVSGAIDALVRMGLLEVRDGTGERRDTASARRAVRGPLFYRLGGALNPRSEVATPSGMQISGRPDSIPERSATESPRIEIESTSQRRLHKAKTTKESETKEIEAGTEIRLDLSSLKSETLSVGEERIARLSCGFAIAAASCTGRVPADEIEPVAARPPEPRAGLRLPETRAPDQNAVEGGTLRDEAEAFVHRFRSAYALGRPGETCPPIEMADRELLARYIKTQGAPTLERWLPAFFASDFGYVRRRSWSLGSYLNSLFVLMAKQERAGP